MSRVLFSCLPSTSVRITASPSEESKSSETSKPSSTTDTETADASSDASATTKPDSEEIPEEIKRALMIIYMKKLADRMINDEDEGHDLAKPTRRFMQTKKDGIYMCDDCEKMFPFPVAETHRRETKSRIEIYYYCDKCGEDIASNDGPVRKQRGFHPYKEQDRSR